ncbi:MAG: TetR/AcrR family transcriptional regulator [bacterium]|nr:TetR/AcrR family transcriptional regulator [bacterium]
MTSKGERTRDFIIQRAAEVFNQYGYSGTSLSDIMRLTGLEKGGIYNHFASKDELAYAAFDYALAVTTARIREIFHTHKHAVDRLLALMDYYFELARGDTLAGGCPILNTAIEADDTAAAGGAMPELKARAKAAMRDLVATIQRTIEKGIERGEIRPDVDSERSATFIVAAMEGALMMTKLYDDETPLHMAAAQVRRLIETELRRTEIG